MAGKRRRVDGNLDRRSARLTAEQRQERNAFIFQAFLAGRTERWIAAHPKVMLTSPWVHDIIKAELLGAAKRQELLADQAKTIYVERLEMLISRAWSKVMDGDLKAIEVGRRLLEQQARFYDLTEERGIMVTPPMSDAEMADMDENSPGYQMLDELTKYRLRQQREAGGM
jgi:hypothetical protein